MYTAIQRWGKSHAIKLPSYIMDAADVRESESVQITVENGDIIIRKAKPHRTMEERFEGFTGDYTFTEMDSGKQQGREII